MACPPHYITSLSVDSDGWIAVDASAAGGLTPGCIALLSQTKLELSSDVFSSKSCDASNKTEDGDIPIEELPHLPNLSNLIHRVMSVIHRVGATSERALRNAQRRKEQEKGGDKSRDRGRRGKGRKAERMEEQRRLRQEKEQQKSEQSQSNVVNQSASREQSQSISDGGEENENADGANDGGGDFIVVAEESSGTNESAVEEELEIPAEQRLAAVFNSLRVLITILRPILHHPQSKDANLKMQNGPSIKKAGKSHRFYLISKHVYSCVSVGCWKELSREYNRLLSDVQDGLSVQMNKRNDDGQYVLDPKDWVANLFDHKLYNNQDLLAEKCISVPSPNEEVVKKLHDALIDRFENEHDEKQYMLQRAIERLQDKLHSAISRRFNGVRLTV